MTAGGAAAAVPFSRRLRDLSLADALPHLAWAAAFAVLFHKPALLLLDDWWNNPEAGHGLLLAPVALWLIWKRGLLSGRRAQRALGLLLLAGAVLLRIGSELAAELYTMKLSMVGTGIALVVFYTGFRQALAWWLPLLLLVLAVPLPELVTSSLALPLQFQASEMGAALLEWRRVPVELSGNIITLPGRQLFVTEACSGLRSLTALLSIGVLMGGLWLRHPVTRVLLLAVAIPIAIAINGARVFLTGFLVYYVDPATGEGFMHLTQGWMLFVVSFLLVGVAAWLILHAERLALRIRHG